MQQVTVAALRILYEAVFPSNDFPHPDVAVVELSEKRKDFNDLLLYASAISANVVSEGNYYERLATQLRKVILERDLCRLMQRHSQSCKAIPNGVWVQLLGRGTRMKATK